MLPPQDNPDEKDLVTAEPQWFGRQPSSVLESSSAGKKLPLERVLPPLSVMAEDVGAWLETFRSGLFNAVIQKGRVPIFWLCYRGCFFSWGIEMGTQEGR